MVPDSEQEVVIVAAFRRRDLVRLHALLACYESPFRTTDELFAWEQDLAVHEALRRYLRVLLDA
jgi:hypothetical protein